jgi:nucleoside-diphosphate-sugar epimerase
VFAADLAELEACKKILTDQGLKQADVIIHLASALAKPGTLEDIEVLNNNNLLSLNVARLAEFLGCKKLINFSSSSVYPNIDGVFNESSLVDPSQNPDAIYGLSKYNSEVILNRILSSKQLVLSHLRSAMVYGEGVHPSRIWPVMEAELKEKNTITVFGNGLRLINQVHIDWLVKVVARFVDTDLPGVYNVSEETISLMDLAKRTIARKGNGESCIIQVEKGNTYQFKMDASKLKSIL